MEVFARESLESRFSIFTTASEKKRVIRLDKNLEVEVGQLCEVPSVVIAGYADTPCRLLIGNFCRIGTDTLIDFSWTHDGPASSKGPRTIRIGNACEIGPRSCLTLGAQVGNCGFVPPGGVCTTTVFPYHRMYALPDLRCLGRAVDATEWWNEFTREEVRSCRRSVFGVATNLTPEMIDRNLPGVCSPLREICARVSDHREEDLPAEVRISGSERFIMAYLFHLLSHGKRPAVRLDPAEREDRSRAATFMHLLCQAYGMRIRFSPPGTDGDDVRYVAEGRGPPSVACWYSVSPSGSYEKSSDIPMSPVDLLRDPE